MSSILDAVRRKAGAGMKLDEPKGIAMPKMGGLEKETMMPLAGGLMPKKTAPASGPQSSMLKKMMGKKQFGA